MVSKIYLLVNDIITNAVASQKGSCGVRKGEEETGPSRRPQLLELGLGAGVLTSFSALLCTLLAWWGAPTPMQLKSYLQPLTPPKLKDS